MMAEAAGNVDGRHFTEYVQTVKDLRRSGHPDEAESLLLRLVIATEAESRVDGYGVAPWYYEQLAILYRKSGRLGAEIAILERYAARPHAPGVKPARLLERLEKMRRSSG